MITITKNQQLEIKLENEPIGGVVAKAVILYRNIIDSAISNRTDIIEIDTNNQILLGEPISNQARVRELRNIIIENLTGTDQEYRFRIREIDTNKTATFAIVNVTADMVIGDIAGLRS